MAEAGYVNHQDQLNRMAPAAARAKLGDQVYDLTNRLNALGAAYADLAGKFNALMAALDTANVAGIGNANAATFDATTTTFVAVKLPEQR